MFSFNSLSRHGNAIFSFGVIQAMQLFLPLCLLPWLSRVLGPDAFGLLMYMCLLPPLISLIMDWGLTPGGARRAALEKTDTHALAKLLGAVFTAKIFIGCGIFILAFFALPFFPYAREYTGAYFLAIGAGIARGISPLWFYQGLGENAQALARCELCVTSGIFLMALCFINTPSNWYLYLLFICLCKGCGYLWLCCQLWRTYQARPDIRGALLIMAEARHLFGSSIAGMLYINGGQLVLGWILTPAQMGILVAVTKMIRALASLSNPIIQTFFSDACVMQKERALPSSIPLGIYIGFLMAGMCLVSGAIWFLAPLLIHMALGKQYDLAIIVLQLMVFSVPLMVCNTAIGALLLVPAGQEKAQMKIIGACAIATWPAAALLGKTWGLIGGAILPVLAELFIFSGLLLTVCKMYTHKKRFKRQG